MKREEELTVNYQIKTYRCEWVAEVFEVDQYDKRQAGEPWVCQPFPTREEAQAYLEQITEPHEYSTSRRVWKPAPHGYYSTGVRYRETLLSTSKPEAEPSDHWISSIRNVGTAMANTLYNLSQGKYIPVSDAEIMKRMVKMWDAIPFDPPKPQPTEDISDGNNVPDYIVQASLDKARQVLGATEGGAHEKGIEASCVSLGHEGVYISVATLERAIAAYRAALNAKPEGGAHEKDWACPFKKGDLLVCHKPTNFHEIGEVVLCIGTDERYMHDNRKYWVRLAGKTGHYGWESFRKASAEEIAAALNAKPEQTEHVDTDVLENSDSLNTSQTDGGGE